jgi:ADP-ribosyl-[dinitrogen reductase] hydrolase
MTGGWRRDLDINLDAIRDWGASAVITLVEEHELSALKVGDLGRKVRERHMVWHHMPIEDVAIPSPQFEAKWADVSEGLRSRLRDGFSVLVHCKGGLGRAGTIAARLLIELGRTPREAVNAVRQARPGAIETSEQLKYVLALTEASEAVPDKSPAATLDRAIGTLLALATGDAIGTTLEFTARDSHPQLTDMVGTGPFRLKAGEWTDDTAMALALADSLAANGGLDEADLMHRFVRWHEQGEYSCTGSCFDIGITTRQALARWKRTGNPKAGSTDPQTAGNGSLMRLAPVAIRFWRDRPALRDVAARQSATTHAAPEAVDACVAFAEVLADAIEGRARSEVLRDRVGPYAGDIKSIMAGSWRGKQRIQIRASGYVAHSLEASLWAVGRTGSFEEAVLLAANLGDDADATAAITGQLAGAFYGAGGLPQRWPDRLAWEPHIREMAARIFS